MALVTLGLNGIIFLTIPFLSQIRDTQPVQTRLAGPPTKVHLQNKDNSPPAEQEVQKPSQPEPPSTLPEPDFQSRQPEMSPPSPPELPDMDMDMPELDVGRVQVNQPQKPQTAKPQPEQSPVSSADKAPETSSRQTKFSLSEVDTHPRVMHKVPPSYPFRAKRRGVEGKVEVRFLVDKKGRVSQVSLIQAEPEGVFEESALKAVRKWRFEPGKKDGQPVATWVQVPIRFELSR